MVTNVRGFYELDKRSRASADLLPGDRARALHTEQDRERGRVMSEDIIGVYLEDRLICVPCSKPNEGEGVTAEALPHGFTCDECWVVVNA